VQSKKPVAANSAIFSDPIGQNMANDKFQFLFFRDYGVASNRYTQSGESRYATFSGIGPGFRYSISQYFSMRFDYDIRLNDPNTGVPEGQSMDLAITLSY
jgi:hemolysin activation/secretion protein